MRDMADSVVPPQPRDYHGWNWSGGFTLYSARSAASGRSAPRPSPRPVVTTLLYMLVFVVAVGSGAPAVDGVSFGHSWPRG
jgi:ABC-2 type transport system permease protein